MPTRPGNRLAVHHSSDAMHWETPEPLARACCELWGLTLDGAAEPLTAKLPRYATRVDWLDTARALWPYRDPLEELARRGIRPPAMLDGLRSSWRTERVWLNPPYGRAISAWTTHAREQSALGALVVALLPSRTDTRWWVRDVMGAAAKVFLISGRVRFILDGKQGDPAPFPTALVLWLPGARRAPAPAFSTDSELSWREKDCTYYAQGVGMAPEHR